MGTASRFLLAVDFDFTGRPEANFGNFAEVSDLDHEVWQTVAPPNSARYLLPAKDYLDFWADLPVGASGHVEAIMGYCVGCVFLPALADRIERLQGRRPALLLFDPQPIAVDDLYQDFRKIVALMTVLSEQEKQRLLAEGGRICEAAGDDFPAAAAKVVNLYDDAVGIAFAHLSLDDAVRVELTEMFRSYVSYLTAASQLPVKGGWQAGTALTSQGSSPGAKSAGKEINFPVRTQDLLRDARVADALFDMLDASTD